MKFNIFLDNKKNVLKYFKNHQFEKAIKFGRKLLKNVSSKRILKKKDIS